MFAALAQALVVTYRSSGVVNFATGAVAMCGAYFYAFLRKGELLILIPGLPTSIDVGGPVATAPAFICAVALAAALGVLLHSSVGRPLRNAPAVSKAVASLGVMVLLQALMLQKAGAQPITVTSILPTNVIRIGEASMRADRLWFAGIILATAVALGAWFRFTKFGLGARAVAETEKGAIVSGLSPQRIGAVSAAVSGAVAGVTGILIAPIVPLTPASYTLFIVPALAAALVAGFSSLSKAVGAGLLIGMLQSELGYLATQHSWLPQHGIEPTLTLVVIFAYLVVAGRSLPQRGAVVTRALGRAPRPQHPLMATAGGLTAGLTALILLDGSARVALIITLIYVVISLSLVVVTGFSGQVSLAQLTIAGASGFVLSRLTFNASVPFPLSMIIAALVCAVIGGLVGLPALRTRGLPVAVITLATAVALEAVWFNNADFGNGLLGSPVPPPTLFGQDLGIGAGSGYPRIAFGILCLVVAVGAGLAVALLRRSRLGASMLALRANERSAAAAGIHVARTKLAAFVIAGFIAGLGGALLAYQQTLASPQTVSALGGLGFFAIVYLAGITSVAGGVLAGILANGGIVAYAVNEYVSVGRWYPTIAGLGLVLSVILNPDGAVGAFHRFAERRHSGDVAADTTVPITSNAAAPTSTPATTAASEFPVLTLTDVSVRYGGVSAVSDVCISVPEGRIVGLIGPNGAGKTTLIDAISGHALSSGYIAFAGSPVHALKPHARSRLGMGRTFQSLDLYDDMTVTENVTVGAEAAHRGKRSAGEAIDAYALLGLDAHRDVLVRELSQGHRQLVSIARALAGRPRVLLLDEPGGGLDSAESKWLGERLRRIRDAGVTLLVIDHDMSLILEVCDEVHVLDLGRLIATGTPAEIKASPVVLDAYLGHATVGGAQ